MLVLGSGDRPIDHALDHKLWGGPITIHTITVVVVGLLALWFMFKAAKGIRTGPESEGNDRYLTKGRIAQLVEMITVFLRDQMLEPVLGVEQTRRYLPYLLTLFFFILANNIFGLIPLPDLQHLLGIENAVVGGAATGNLAVTGALAFVSFLVIQAHGFRELGVKGWAHHLLGGAPWWLFPLMVPVELIGHIIKPGALAVRLLANMVAGHTLLAALFLFGKAGSNLFEVVGISFAAGLFALAISFLELFVAVLQAFIFMFLTAVFISLLSHHGDHDDEHAHDEHGASEAQPATT